MEQVEELRGLIQWNGQLCLATFKPAASSHNGCPNCHAEVYEHFDWLQCSQCSLAILKADVERMNKQVAGSH